MEKKHPLDDSDLKKVSAGSAVGVGPCPPMPKGSGPDPDTQGDLDNQLSDDDSLSEIDAG